MSPKLIELRNTLLTVDLKELNSICVNNTVSNPLHYLTLYLQQRVMNALCLTIQNAKMSIPYLSYETTYDCVTYIVRSLGIDSFEDKLKTDIADIIAIAVYSLSRASHNYVLCEDFVQHWETMSLDIINMNYRDAVWFNMNNPQMSGDSELTGMVDTLREALLAELNFLYNINVPEKVLLKLAKYLEKRKLNKYSKLLDAWGYVPNNLLKNDNGEWVSWKIQAHQIPTLKPTLGPLNFGSMEFKPFIKDPVPDNILNYLPTATDPIEQSLEVDRFYIKHDITMIPPMSFGKTLAEVIFLQGTGLMTMEKVEAEVTKMLKYILGPDMYKYVSLDQSKEGLALSVKSQDSKIMDAIANKLAYTLILN